MAGPETPDTYAPPEEDFKLLDVDGTTTSAAAGSWGSTSNASDEAASTSSSSPPPPRQDGMRGYAFAGLNMLISCSALAVAKQMLNPAIFSAAGGGSGGAQAAADAARQEATQQLPAWFQNQYQQKRASTAVTHLIAKDVGVLMAASGMYYGLQNGLHSLRGQQDGFNVCVAGAVSAGFLGATFFEPLKLSRAGIWGIVGGVAGWYGYQQQQAMRVKLLTKQQELEQKHLHVAPERVHTKLDGQLLRKLLEMEQKEQRQQLAAAMQRQGVDLRRAAAGNGGPDAADAAGAEGAGGAAAAGGGTGSGRLPPRQLDDGSDDAWQRLLSSAPWLTPQSDGDAAAGGGEDGGSPSVGSSAGPGPRG